MFAVPPRSAEEGRCETSTQLKEVERTKKKNLVLAIGLILITAASGLFVAMRVSASPAPPPPTLFSYAAKWICNFPNTIFATPFDPSKAENIGLVAGEYKTDINVHNPSNATANLFIQKKFAVSVPESPTPISPFTFRSLTLHPDGAFFIDCNDIFTVLSSNPQAMQIIISNGGAAKGFVVLNALTDKLDVVAEYSQIGFNCALGSCTPVGSSLDVERVPARPFVA